MPAEIRIYFEGDDMLKPGFHAFLSELREGALTARSKFRIISGGSRGQACQDFSDALRSHPGAWNILLIDGEGPVGVRSAAALCARYGWPASTSDSIFWMVEMMEAWFQADRSALATFYGRSKFAEKALKGSETAVEIIPKRDLEAGLRAATRHTQKGDYFRNKTTHGPKLLSEIDPKKVRNAAPNCERLFDKIKAGLIVAKFDR